MGRGEYGRVGEGVKVLLGVVFGSAVPSFDKLRTNGIYLLGPLR
jgi:hypothetical protein